MKVLFDTNVILDVLLDREPFADDASYLLSKVERSEIIGYVCATTITTIHYLATKALGSQEASLHIDSLLSLFVIAPVNRLVLERAAISKFNDFKYRSNVVSEPKKVLRNDSGIDISYTNTCNGQPCFG